MKQWYEVKHRGRTKKFDNAQEAFKLAGALESVGYEVEVVLITLSIYTTTTTILYQTPKN